MKTLSVPRSPLSTVILFSLRLFFYFSMLSLISVHPGIVISFDRIGILQWFLIIPMQAVIAFLPLSIQSYKKKFIIAGASLLVLSVIAGGFGLAALEPFFAGLVSFILTFLLFHYPRWGKPAMLEPFFLVWVCLRLLSLSRSGEEIAGQSIALTQFILVWSAVVFLLYSGVVYLCLFPNSMKGAGKESALFLAASLAALMLVLVVLPADFINNSIIENLLPERVPEMIREDSERGLPREATGRRQGRRTLPRNSTGQRPGLRGISEHEWHNRTRRGRGDGSDSQSNQQYMVKIVASEKEPVYMGDAFRGQLDPIEGFLLNMDEPLNNLSRQRLFVTWRNSELNRDAGRENLEVISLSTLSQKYMPYRPVLIDPTIQSEDSGPLRFIHQIVSSIHVDDPLMLARTPSRRFSLSEELALASYLDIPLYEEDLHQFNEWLDNALLTWQENRELFINSNPYLHAIFTSNDLKEEDAEAFDLSDQADSYVTFHEPVNEYLEKIIAILVGFSEYQYNLSYNDDHSIESIKEFLFETADGDCVEFSNSLALLGRLAGVPSRVVTGFLVAESLQTEAHLRGLYNLRNKIPFLQQFPFDNLFLVTNLHAHSWTQFYIPGCGWLDFEATAFALPPEGMGDFNTWDVVIPVIDDKKVFSNIRKFPWRAALRSAATLAVIALVLAYVLRYGREAVLYYKSQKSGSDPVAGARALYLLLLARLAADGKPIKPASKTAAEYTELFLHTKGAERTKDTEMNFILFADLYSQLRWRKFETNEEREECFNKLKQEYQHILTKTKRAGILGAIIRILSLRGLAYL